MFKNKLVQYAIVGFLAIIAIQILASVVLVLLPMIGRAFMVVLFAVIIYKIGTKLLSSSPDN